MLKTTKISIRSLYKIFGNNPDVMMEHVLNGLGKQDLLKQHAHVMGLQNINVDIQSGEITVIMGLSGSGKSTLIRHLNRLIEPTSGEVFVNGENVLDYGVNELRQLRRNTMSMVFQKFALLPHKTVLENTGMSALVRGEDIEETSTKNLKWLERVGLSGYDNHYPHQLSGGMQQRVGIARALASDSEIMLMDEAYSALDPLIRTDMQDLLLELQKELHKTIVFITHDLDEALKLADHLVILKDGYVVQQGDPQGILLNPKDPYIEEFVADINRARVLRVRSVMSPKDGRLLKITGQVQASDNLEKVIALSGGNTNCCYEVVDNDETVGTLHMKELVRALVP
ncbi:betaine/proline/choline family ABC transporter ATP-binding protein [Amylibacter sp. SFDW26]|uniref:quaternary amine ABC transporter ATP-binding protein n=1 Tax=Amylibacter sp. SFDW26 TaxID=2652722 RepID=UPI001261CB69|nr:betaine/proline/choline family ABC transporter ATP-binding protein [Amylibacter sp. SFDW26]KAB7610267.1 betaine/proline/choline family ABC transporter ATP-binding protein [Amylibacter sp. SFDW26]